MKPQLTQPVCLLMHGIPGAGKSAFARQFSEQLDIAHINSDRIRFELFDDAQFGSAENTTVWRMSSYIADLLLSQGQSIVFDMHLPTRTLRNTLKMAAKRNGAAFIVVWVQTDYETAQYRAANRDRRRLDDKYSFPLSPQLHEKLTERGSDPLENDSSIVISGKHLFRTQLGPVLRKLKANGLLNSHHHVPAGNRDNGGRVDHGRRTLRRV